MKIKNSGNVNYVNNMSDVWGCFVFLLFVIIFIAVVLAVSARIEPCYGECRYKQTYDRCVAREDLSIEQCHDIALESMD